MIKFRRRPFVILVFGIFIILLSSHIFFQIYTEKYSPRFYAYVSPGELLLHHNHSTLEINGSIFSSTNQIVGEIPITKSIFENIYFGGHIFPPRDSSRIFISDQWIFEDWYAIDDYEVYRSITLNGERVTLIKLNDFKQVDENWIAWQKRYPFIFLFLFILGISIIYPLVLKRDIIQDVWYNVYKGKLNKAILLLEKGLEIDPTDIIFLNLMGYVLTINNEIEEAFQYLDKSISLDAKNADAYYYKGFAFYRINNLNEAVVYYNKAVDIKPDYSTYYFLARVYSMLGDEKKAIESLTLAKTFEKYFLIENSKVNIELKNLKANPEFAALLKYD